MCCNMFHSSRLNCLPKSGELSLEAGQMFINNGSTFHQSRLTTCHHPQTIDHRIYTVTVNTDLNSHLNTPDLWYKCEKRLLARVWWSLFKPASLFMCSYILWNHVLDKMLICTTESATARLRVLVLLYDIVEWKQGPECAFTALLSASSLVARAYIDDILMAVQSLASSICKARIEYWSLAQRTGACTGYIVETRLVARQLIQRSTYW